MGSRSKYRSDVSHSCREVLKEHGGPHPPHQNRPTWMEALQRKTHYRYLEATLSPSHGADAARSKLHSPQILRFSKMRPQPVCGFKVLEQVCNPPGTI